MMDIPSNPNPRKKRTRINRDTQARIVHLIQKMLIHGHFNGDIKSAISEKFGISSRSVERYITRARREMHKHANNYVEQHRTDSFYFYNSIVENSNSADRDRIRARERIDRLLGLDTEVASEEDLTPEQLRQMSNEEFCALYNSRFGTNRSPSELYQPSYVPAPDRKEDV